MLRYIFVLTTSRVSKRDVFLVANMYWMIAFKIHVSNASSIEGTSNRNNSEIWKSFLSCVFSSIF